MIPSIAQRVIQLNNKSIADMINGQHEGAIKTLQSALSMLLKLQEQPEMSVHRDADDKKGVERNFFSCTVPLTATSRAPLQQQQHRFHQTHNNDVFEFFNRAIILPECNDDDDDDDESCLDLYSSSKNKSRVQAILLYNIAACYHVHGIEFGDSTALSQALTYYGWSYYAIESSSHIHGFQDVLLLVLASFNNMGNIHATFMNTEKTRQCFHWMQSTFATPTIQQSLQEQDFKFFFQYISVTANQQLLLSPAA